MFVSRPQSESVLISVVIPVYNEGATLAEFLPDLKRELDRLAHGDWEIVVVDDGSTDNSRAIANAAGVKLCCQAQRSGSGAARKTGSLAAMGKLIGWMDGDGTYSVEGMSIVLKALENADQVVGERSTDYGHMRFVRLLVKRFTAKVAGWLWSSSIPDLNSGLRAFRRESLLVWLHEIPDGFSCTTTATLAALNHRQRVKFLPISYYARRMSSPSKFHPVWDTLRLWRAVWRCWRRRRGEN